MPNNRNDDRQKYALELMEEVRTGFERCYGPYNHLTLSIVSDMAEIFKSLGDDDKALEFHQFVRNHWNIRMSLYNGLDN
jgi:hypothetical protein